MSAIIERVASPVADARGALDAARHDLALLDERLAAHSRDVDANDLATQQHRMAKITAVGAGLPAPKPPKLKAIDADVVPILRGKRKEIAGRVAECEGRLRGACVEDVVRRYQIAQAEFATRSASLIATWRELVGVRALLDQSGYRGEPLPYTLTSDFTLPAFGRLRPICENHAAHFVASHAIAQGELSSATRNARAEVERDIGMKLPW